MQIISEIVVLGCIDALPANRDLMGAHFDVKNGITSGNWSNCIQVTNNYISSNLQN